MFVRDGDFRSLCPKTESESIHDPYLENLVRRRLRACAAMYLRAILREYS